MATGSPVSFWYGTRAQFDSITTKLDTTLYFITDEQALYKGTVKFSGSGVDTLLTISSTTPSASIVTTGDKYFDTSDNLIHVLLNDNGTVSTTATYEPANGALYYNADAQRFQTLVKDGSSYIPTEIYDAGISVEDGTGLVLNGTTVAGLDATTNSKGVVQVGTNLNVSNGVLSVPVATNAVFGVVKSGSNITNNNGVLSVAKATASSLGVVKVGSNINVDNNGQISVPVANGSTKGVVSAGENVYNSDGVLSVNTATTGTKGVVQVGTNIDVNNGVISVKDASTSNKGVVQLTNDLADIHSTALAATPNLVATVTDDLDGRKQDNMTATAPVDIDNSNVSLNIGDGLAVGVAGSTNANKLIVNEASVKEVLEDVVDGGTEPAVNEIVTADNLKGALSVGQAVDVSCPPLVGVNLITYQDASLSFLGTINVAGTMGGTTLGVGWSHNVRFQKYAPNLKYLYVLDIKNTSSDEFTWYISPYSGGDRQAVAYGETLRIWGTSDDGYYMGFTIFHSNQSGRAFSFEVTNWRQYEVTALTDEAIAYIAKLEDPDTFFRSNTIDTVKNKYLVKNDMVCPWIKTISMPDNSDLTVASGLAYKIKYTNDSPHIITADTIPADAYGQDAHIKMFIKGTSAIHFTEPLVLMNALTPNAGHNISVKFRDGQAFVYVDDTDAGYVITVASGNTNGTLNYAITGGTTDYAIFSADLDGTTVDAGDATFVGGTGISAVNVLGNGTDKTTITGNISATSGNTINFQSLTIDGGTLGGAGTMNLDATSIVSDTEVISGCTVNFSGTNTLDATLSGAGKLVFSANSTLVSVGGLGTISNTATNTLNDNVTFSDITITGRTSGYGAAISSSVARRLNLINCVFTSNKATSGSGGVLVGTASSNITITGCTFSGNSAYYSSTSVLYTSGQLYAKNCVLLGSVIQGITVNANTTYIENIVLQNGKVQHNAAGTVVLVAGSTVDSTGNQPSTYLIHGTGTLILQDNITIIGYDGTIASVDALKCKGMDTDRRVGFGDITITGSTKSVWSASNVLFGYKIDASETYTVKFSGTRFTGDSKIFNTNRVQLPAGSTNSFQGNTNDADTKILDASLIVVGDNPASPSGSATVVNASGTSSTVTGIGTYIDKEGDNDFVANNATNVIPVDASTTGAKYLGTVLSATTGETGANRFAKIDSGAVAVVNEATDAVNKQIITHDYEPILGGTFSLTSATVNEATKTVAIQSGGTMSIVDIRGGKDSVINLNGTGVTVLDGTSASASNVNVTDGTSQAAFMIQAGATANFNGVHFLQNGNSNVIGGALSVSSGGAARTATVNLTSCVFDQNVSYNNRGVIALLVRNVVVDISGSTFGENQGIFARGSGKTYNVNFSGENKFLASFYPYNDGTAMTVTIASGAVLDLTGNTNLTPINPGGAITFATGGATVLYSSGAVSGSYMMDNVTLPAGAKLTNTAVVDFAKSCCTLSNKVFNMSGATIVSGSDSTAGGFSFGNGATGSFTDCIVSGCTGFYGGVGRIMGGAKVTFTNCVFSGNQSTANYAWNAFGVTSNGSATFSNCELDNVTSQNIVVSAGGHITIGGVENKVNMIQMYTASDTVIISSGASINLVSSIRANGTESVSGITIKDGGCMINGVQFGSAGGDTIYKSIVSSGGSAVAYK